MVALADAGLTVTDVALELGCDRRKTWSILNGHEPPPAELHGALERLADDPAAILDVIPRWSSRAPMSPAVSALRAADVSTVDLAEIMRVLPSTAAKMLRGKLPRSPKLAAALEQLLGEAAAANVLALIPSRNGPRGPVRMEVRVARIAIGSLLRYADNPAALAATPADIARWRQLGELAAAVLAAQ